MKTVSGADLAGRIHNSSDGCPKCGTLISFMDGLKTARNAGIEYNVLMCSKCLSVFEVNVTGNGYTFSKDVTSEFERVLHGKKCTACLGSKNVACYRCNGLGYMGTCAICNGKKQVDCSCNQGKAQCNTCNGQGKIPFLFTLLKKKCHDCDGRGWFRHKECNGNGVLSCKECNGIGMINPCSECSTKGKVECNVCSGYGWIL
jgi:hypothetical protein